MKSNEYYKVIDLMKTIDEGNKFPLKNSFSVFENDLVFQIKKETNLLDKLRRKFDLQVTEVMKLYNILDDDMREKMHILWKDNMKKFLVPKWDKWDIIFSVVCFSSILDTSQQSLFWDVYKKDVFRIVEEIAEKKLSK